MGRKRAFQIQNLYHKTINFADGGNSQYLPDRKLGDQPFGKDAKFNEIAIRETAWDYYRVLGFLPNPEKILRKLGKDVEVYDELLSDSRVKAAFNSRRAGTLSLKWDIEQGKSPIRQYKLIRSIFDSFPIYDILSETLKCDFYGYQPLEVLWKKIGTQVLPEQIVPKTQRWFRYSDINELRYLTKRNMITGEPIPEYKFIVARHHPSYDNPYGESLGAVCYWPVKFRHAGFKFYMQFVEKYAMPWVLGTYPLGTRKERVQEMLQMLDETIQDGVIVSPEEMKITSMDMSQKTAGQNYNQFIDVCNTEITMAILGQNLTSEVKGGSYAAAKIHGTIRKDLVDEDIRVCEYVMNTLIDWIFDLNFGGESDARPKFKMIPAPQPTKEDADMAFAMYQSGVRFTDEYWMNRFGLIDEEFNVQEPSLQEGAIPIDPNKQPPVEPGANGGTDTKGIHQALHESKDPARNSQSAGATADLRAKGAYGPYAVKQ